MNILYIDHYAGSTKMGMEFRPYYMAIEWIKKGHNVTIIAADYSHLRTENPSPKKNFTVENIDGIDYCWIHTMQYEGNGAKRAATMVQFCAALYFAAHKISRTFNPDVVISSSTYPLDTFPARRIAKISNAKYVHEVHDMWPIVPMELYGMSKRHPFVWIMQRGENFFCKHADKVVSILPEADKHLIRHGMDKDKFRFVPNGVVLADWENPKELPDSLTNVINKAHAENRFIITFFGSHTRPNSLDTLIQGAAKASAKNIFLLFVGGGDYKAELEQLAQQKLSNDQYHFHDPIPKMAIPNLVKSCDASYVGALKNDMFRFGAGMNKLFDAMMGGRPILYSVEAPNNYVEEYRCGVSVAAEDEDALAAGIDTLVACSDEERAAMGNRGKDAVLQRFNYMAIADSFLNVLSE